MADLLRGGIAINEVLVDPNGGNNYDTDGNGVADGTDEFIEFVNVSNGPIDIGGLQIWDAGVGLWFTFPPNTILAPGAHAMVISGIQPGGTMPTGNPGDLFFDAGRNSPVINNSGDNIVVYDPLADEYISARFNNDALDDPTGLQNGYELFSPTASLVGAGENFGRDADGFSIQRVPDGSDTFGVNTPTPGVTNICFADGTFFQTETGPVAIKALRPEMRIATLDNGFQTVRWVYSKHWTAAEIAAHPSRAPVRIRAGALGHNMPERALHVSQQHRLLIAGPIAKRMFGTTEVLVAAKHLTSVTGIKISRKAKAVSYYHVMLDQHDILVANGAPAESLYLGKCAVAGLTPEAIRELCDLLDRPIENLCANPSRQARVFVKGRRARQLAARHLKNRKPLSTPQLAGRVMAQTYSVI
ncbi:Hint domain-containing protein [Actibacterium lipolyticum]|uniref:LTD domain-containing protein n=1 Tax=Actibacterium lipolyticum TaxID=1524263 RepID=A0A238KQP9_9RHOB|nr:Hint domain-containing protein [Actibacterium lipolyticum]SMX45184.1 hypothetical protein COL8621_02736 [Actibacterium lipolyticum]